MARYVVLSFEDDNEAEEFVKDAMQLDDHPTFSMAVTAIDPGGNYEKAFDFKVEAMMQKPTKFCGTPGGCREGKRVVGFQRGKNHGWWICSVCGKPTQTWAQSIGAVLGSSVDKLRDRMSQQMEREKANDEIEDYRTSRRMNIGRYPDGGAR